MLPLVVFASVLCLLGSFWFSRSKTASWVLAWLGLFPVSCVAIFYAFLFGNTSGMSEAIFVLFLFCLIGGFVLATLLCLMLVRVWGNEGSMRVLGWSALIGLGISPAHYLCARDSANFFSTDWTPFLVLAAIDTVCIGIFLAWIAGSGAGAKLKKAPHTYLAILPVLTACLGAYLLPNVAFRIHSLVRPPMTPLAKIGANRALHTAGRYREKAIIAFAVEGDRKQLKVILNEVINGTADPNYNVPYILSQSMDSDPDFSEAILERLKRIVDANGQGIEPEVYTLCDVLTDTKDVRSIPLLIRLYALPSKYETVRYKAAQAIVAIGGEEAAKFAAAQLDNLDAVNDQRMADLLRQLNHPLMNEAKKAFFERVKRYKADRSIREQPTQNLVANKNVDALRNRAATGQAQQRAEATIALIQMGDAERIQVALANTYGIRYMGKELNARHDPELLKALTERLKLDSKKPDMNVARFIADWAPPGSARIQARLLFRLSLGEAADALGLIGGEEASNALLGSLKSLRGAENTLKLQVIRALGRAKSEKAVPILAEILRGQPERPCLNYNGHDIYTGDVAAEALRDIGTKEALEALKEGMQRGNTMRGDPVALQEWYRR